MVPNRLEPRLTLLPWDRYPDQTPLGPEIPRIFHEDMHSVSKSPMLSEVDMATLEAKVPKEREQFRRKSWVRRHQVV